MPFPLISCRRLPSSFHLSRPWLLRALPGLLLVPVLIAAERPAEPVIAPPADWVRPVAWTAPAALEANPTGENFLLLEDQVRLATDEHYHHHAFQIVTDGGRQHGAQVYINFDPSFQTLTIHQLKLVRDGETFDRLEPAKIQVLQQERELDRQLYNGERSALVILEDVRVGDIIDVAYTLHGQNPVFGGKFIDSFYVEWGVPVRDLRYRLLVPKGRRISYSQLPLTPVIPAAKPEFRSQPLAGELELSWRRTDIGIIEGEENVPNSYQVFSFVDVSEFGSWGEVAEWALPLYALDLEPHPLLDTVVADLKRKSTTPEQRAVAALAFVQQEIRYLGIEMGPSSHRPSEPEEVLRRRFGDCKDKARLLTALYQRLNLHAAPALVHSSRREAVRERRPSPYAFDHVIVALDLGGRRYLLDPTMSYQRGDRLDLRHVGRYGPYLRIAPGSWQLEESMLGNADVSRTTIREDFQVDNLEQPAGLTVTTTAEGRAADGLRAYFSTRTIEQIGREYLDYYTRYHRGITQQSPVESSDNPGTNTYTVKEHYRINQLFARESDGPFVRAQFEPAAIWDYLRPPNLAQRKFPYAISFPVNLQEVITVNLPADWSIKPEQQTISDDAFALTLQVSNPTPRTVRLEHNWVSRAWRVEPARLPVFSAKIDQARKQLGYQLSWNTAVSTSPAVGRAIFPPNWPMIALATGILLAGGYLSWRLPLRPNPSPPSPPVIDPAKPVDPYSYQARVAADVEGLGGWLVLVAFGLVVRPLMMLSTIIRSRDAYFNDAVWRILSTPSSQHYRANFTLLAPLELMLNCTLLAYSIVLLTLFFRRSHLFPRAIQIFLGLCVLGTVFDIWDHAMLAQTGSNQQMESYTRLGQAVIGAAIWIPYFQVSRRVKRTFVR